MKRCLFIFCLLSNAMHGMENTHILSNTDILDNITQSICINDSYKPKFIKKNIRALYETNKFLHDYYAQEKNAQSLVKFCALRRSYMDNLISNDENMAEMLGCHKIKEKIDYFSKLVWDKERQFTLEDLNARWYLNCTTDQGNRSLLYIAIDHNNLGKALLIINNALHLDFKYSINQNILWCILSKLRKKQTNHVVHWQREWLDKEFDKKLLEIVELLLKKGLDSNKMVNSYTPLQEVVSLGNKDLFRLLLKYGADFKEYGTQVGKDFPDWALDIIQEMNCVAQLKEASL